MSYPRKPIWVEIGGESMTLHEASERYGIIYLTLKARFNNGARGDDLVRPPNPKARRIRRLIMDGNLSLTAIAERVGCSRQNVSQIYARVHQGKD